MRRGHGSIDWKAGVWAGLIAGLADEFIMTAVVMIQGVPSGVPTRMTAAMLLGPGMLPPPETLTSSIMAAALIVHFGLSVVFGIVTAVLLRRIGTWPSALFVGVAIGVGIWFVDYFVIAPTAFPWMVPMRAQPATPILHALFGLVAAAAYMALRSDERRSGRDRRQMVYKVLTNDRRRSPGRRRHAAG